MNHGIIDLTALVFDPLLELPTGTKLSNYSPAADAPFNCRDCFWVTQDSTRCFHPLVRTDPEMKRDRSTGAAIVEPAGCCKFKRKRAGMQSIGERSSPHQPAVIDLSDLFGKNVTLPPELIARSSPVIDLSDLFRAPKSKPDRSAFMKKVRFEGLRQKEDTTEKKLFRGLSTFRSVWIDALVSRIRPHTLQTIHLLTLDPDDSAIRAMAGILRPARAWAKAEVYRERRRATRRKASDPVITDLSARARRVMADLAEEGGKKPSPRRRDPNITELIAQTTVSDAQASLINRARSSFIDNVKDGFEDEELETLIRTDLDDMSEAAFAQAAREGARQIVFDGRIEAYRELDGEIRLYIRREQDDENTCDPCRAGDGTEWESLEEVDWSRGDDCEGGDQCRGDLIAVYADEGLLVAA